MEKHWRLKPPLPPEQQQALQPYPPVVRQLLYNRGVNTHRQAEEYLDPSGISVHESKKLLGIEPAIERIQTAIRRQEGITIYGDYDVDGVTASALLFQILNGAGAKVDTYIPNRFTEGYGLNEAALEKICRQGTRLVITVDNGIRSMDEAVYAFELGLDLIITDHHHPGPEMPIAVSIINPKQPGDDYPEKNLSGVGLAYKLAAALLASLDPADRTADLYLDLVALGTVADMVPLTGENRALVRKGLSLLSQPRRQGLMSLISIAGLYGSQLRSSDIGFILGPRINAAGRLASAGLALELLIAEEPQQAGRLAQELENLNRQRQDLTRRIEEQAEAQALSPDSLPLLLHAASPEFNPGVIGLAASRLMNRYYRPSIVAHVGPEFTRGSCRSIDEFHITDALEECAELMTKFGGHAGAAGFTVPNDRWPDLIEQLEEIAARKLGGQELLQTIDADLEIPLGDLTPELLNFLDLLQPTGIGNQEAVFITRNLKVTHHRAVGRDQAHLKMKVSDGWTPFDAIAFRQGWWADQLPARIDLLYTFEMNEFNGRSYLQLNVKDIKPARMAR